MPSYKASLDKVSIIVSFACLVHCLVLPVVLSTLPLFGIELLENRYIETGTVLTSLLVGGWAILRGYRNHHQQKLLPVLFGCGIGCMIVSIFISQEAIEIVLKLAGALLIVTSHILNWRACRRCEVCHK